MTVKWLAVWLVAMAVACHEEPPKQPTTVACAGTPGVACFGTREFVEYTAGELPIVVSVPHGGTIAPAGIPDRTVGTNVTDANTIDLGRAIVQAFQARTGRAPHLVLSHLRRSKLDANRDVAEGAQGNPDAVRAWTEYHGFVDQAAQAVVVRHARGLYIDLHGHGHPTPRLELGYLLSSATLGLSDLVLNTGPSASQSSLRLVMTSTTSTFAEVLRGPTSVGGLLGGYTPAVPSPATVSPGNDPYFNGGYSTARHTAVLPGLQIESHFSGIRDTAANRAAFAAALVTAVTTFLATHLNLVI